MDRNWTADVVPLQFDSVIFQLLFLLFHDLTMTHADVHVWRQNWCCGSICWGTWGEQKIHTLSNRHTCTNTQTAKCDFFKILLCGTFPLLAADSAAFRLAHVELCFINPGEYSHDNKTLLFLFYSPWFVLIPLLLAVMTWTLGLKNRICSSHALMTWPSSLYCPCSLFAVFSVSLLLSLLSSTLFPQAIPLMFT